MATNLGSYRGPAWFFLQSNLLPPRCHSELLWSGVERQWGKLAHSYDLLPGLPTRDRAMETAGWEDGLGDMVFCSLSQKWGC